MCLIVDVNVAERVLCRSDDPDFCHVHNCLFTSRTVSGRLVYGGKLLREYGANRAVMRVLLELDRAGRARKVSDHAVDAECARLESQNLCLSNDAHIIALARVGRVRLLCSLDQKLHKDFGNKQLLDEPRGKVYQNSGHRRLLKEFCKSPSDKQTNR